MQLQSENKLWNQKNNLQKNSKFYKQFKQSEQLL